MYFGTSFFLIAVGAVLYFAVTATVAGIDIQTVGLILMIVGVLALIISFSSSARELALAGQSPKWSSASATCVEPQPVAVRSPRSLR